MAEQTTPAQDEDQPNTCPFPTEDQLPGPEHFEVRRLTRRMKSDPLGIFDLGRDGVFRSLTADRKVIDAIALPTHLIRALLETFPTPHDQDMEDKFRGVDGTKTTKEKWYNPDPGILPPPLSKEEKEQAERFHEENKEVIDRNLARMNAGEAGCPLVVRSRYNLEPQA